MDTLPVEVVQSLVRVLEIDSVFTLRGVSRHLRDIVDITRQYRSADFSVCSINVRRQLKDMIITPSFKRVLANYDSINLTGTLITTPNAVEMASWETTSITLRRCGNVHVKGFLTAVLSYARRDTQYRAVIHTDEVKIAQYGALERSLATYSRRVSFYRWSCKDCPRDVLSSNWVFSIPRCHDCNRYVMSSTSCANCRVVTCNKCLGTKCTTASETCTMRYCRGCIDNSLCQLCGKNYCVLCFQAQISVYNCYACQVQVCSLCMPSSFVCDDCEQEYCGMCTDSTDQQHCNWLTEHDHTELRSWFVERHMRALYRTSDQLPSQP
ncbi:hypothetical protein BC939DRAFT_451755 [Gamsiella multidivaricata]|uniref:uncharacterized protein n=1 Tax=Gamsiella multidivaricata TaxID=101098 RepID=UPI00221EA7F0|nr:uncharacterized protein BC939DRAFT_451755 [Gamsiella multidivaricata]KAG0361663.1 hypothetical protein BGZ54_009024 [Gamsiella multidivaricata]KAI7823342.1 hypothetical protein BC939DRAFT_451755 [Gamsiella multidivaricata]